MSEPWMFERCQVLRAIDGDSVRIVVDTGFKHAATVDVRLLGVDTPERGQPGYAEAAAFTRDWLASAGRIVLECHGEDKYGGRWLGVLRDHAGASLADALIAAGLGKPYFGGKKS